MTNATEVPVESVLKELRERIIDLWKGGEIRISVTDHYDTLGISNKKLKMYNLHVNNISYVATLPLIKKFLRGLGGKRG